MPTDDILQGLDEEFKVWSTNLQQLAFEKDARIKKLHEMLNQLANTINESVSYFDEFKPNVQSTGVLQHSQSAIAKAIKAK